jgi:hypothetical protein
LRQTLSNKIKNCITCSNWWIHKHVIQNCLCVH